jgi:PIN domain nuclease of toxin-antitoxin system
LILLLDTHVFLWQVLQDERLGEKQKAIIKNKTNTIYLSAVSIYEMSIKAGLGKLGLPARYKSNLLLIYDDFDYVPLNLNAAHGNAAGFLTGEHRDPFDRMLAAQSIIEKMPIMSVDKKLADLGAEVVW